MIETILIDYLNSKLIPEVYAERPIDIPEKYVLIEKTGTSRENMITTSVIAIQSVVDALQGGSMLDAMDLEIPVEMTGESMIKK